MSDKRFDEHIKKQLESVKPPYNEMAWKSFQKLLPKPWYHTFFQQYTGWIYGGAAGLTLMVTILLYVRENKTQTLPDNTAALKTQIVQAKVSPGTLAAADSTHVNKPNDTLHLQANKPGFIQKDGQRSVSPAGKSEQQQQGPVALLEAPQPLPAATPLASKRPNPQVLPPDQNKSSQKAIMKKAFTAMNAATATRQPAFEPLANTSPPDREPATGSAAQLPQRTAADSSLMASQAAPDSTAAATLEKPAGLAARIGVATFFQGQHKVAGGLIGELLLNSRVGISTGLLWRTADRQHHTAMRDFDKATGRRFMVDFRRHIPRHDRIDKIEVKTTVVSLPVIVQYYFPSPGRFSFLLHGGSILDLKASHAIAFSSSFQGQTRLIQFKEKVRPQTLNNLVIGVGGQIHLGPLLLQACPYVNLHLQDQGYLYSQRLFGLNMNLKFNLE